MTLDEAIEQLDKSLSTPTKLLVSPAQMEIMRRQMMDGDTLGNSPVAPRKDIYEDEE